MVSLVVGPSGEFVTSEDWARSPRNCDLSIALTFLHVTTFRTTRGLERSVATVSKKWSDMHRFSVVTDLTSFLALDKTISRM